MRPQRISAEFTPDPDGTLAWSAFLTFLERLRSSLYYTARNPDDPTADLKVRVRLLDLEHEKNKKFSVTADVLASNGHLVTAPGSDLVANLGRFRTVRMKEGPPVRDMDVLHSYQRLVEPVQKQIARQVTIAAGGRRVSITKPFVERLSRVIGPDRRERGSVRGRLLRVNLYRAKRFDIFPSVGPRRIAATFSGGQQEAQVIAAVGKYVIVEGSLRFKQWDLVPYAIEDVTRIEAYDQASLPTLDDLRGMAPEALGSMTSEEFLDSLREKEDW